ncbi:hypothetical protein GQX73_g3285 [Xylaria multiplex]|uniref:Enoyl reductase (ER) domain-containing protein n=1 Tax=Xylaria multiplex TaxID=323545 RepID=A0A7C8IZP2_9PEZI|nr:hypothetical protein GQX73_g3285 [Xylaria multiplex]
MAVPTIFKAAVLPEAGAKHSIGDRELSPLQPDEVGIKITATAINPVDWKIRDYRIFLTQYPAVLGSDAAGEVAAVGSAVTDFAVGDRVFFQGIIGKYDYSTFQQYCKMPARLLAKTPRDVSDEQAAGISLATLAVITGFYDKTGHGMPAPWDKGGDRAGTGKAVIVLGGSSSVGQYALQFARLSGFTKIITNASTAQHEYLRTLGAHVVLDRSKAGPEDFKAAVSDTPLAFIFDAISSQETQTLGVQILRAVQAEGNYVVVVQPVDSQAAAEGEKSEPQVQIKQILGLGSSPALTYLSEPLFKHLGGEDGYIAKGLFAPNRPIVIPGGLNGLEAALARNKEGVSAQKVVIRPFDK